MLLATLCALLAPSLAPSQPVLAWHWAPPDGDSSIGGRFVASDGTEPSAVLLHCRWETTLQYRAVSTGVMQSEFGRHDWYDRASVSLYWHIPGTLTWIDLAAGEHETAYHVVTTLVPWQEWRSGKQHQASEWTVLVDHPLVLGALGRTAGITLDASVNLSASAHHAGVGTVAWTVASDRRLIVDVELLP